MSMEQPTPFVSSGKEEKEGASRRGFLKAVGAGALAFAGFGAKEEASAGVIAVPNPRMFDDGKSYAEREAKIRSNKETITILSSLSDEDMKSISDGEGLSRGGEWIVVPDKNVVSADENIRKKNVAVGAALGAVATGIVTAKPLLFDEKEFGLAAKIAAGGAVVGGIAGAVFSAKAQSRSRLIENYFGVITREVVNNEITRLQKLNEELKKDTRE